MNNEDLLEHRENLLVQTWRKLRLYEQALDVACAEIARLKLENGAARAEPTADDLALLQEMHIRW